MYLCNSKLGEASSIKGKAAFILQRLFLRKYLLAVVSIKGISSENDITRFERLPYGI